MARIQIDGQFYSVPEGNNVLSTCLSLGLDLPYFCWHPAMGSAGACRQCAIIQYKDEEDTRGRLVMACMTPVTDNLRISLNAEQAQQFRRDNIELLMTNHPHDCPVCEEGGECHLQDMTHMTGHNLRRYRGRKRTHNNQNLGPFINHEMNRCIACYRCTRFYNEYAGCDDLQVFGIHNNVYFGRFEDGALESEFSGNLVEVCPTGVFTDKTFSAHFTRKWDLQTAPSICVHCSLGCNISPGERYGELRRIVNRYNGDVNGYFLCDRGRFGYDFVNSSKRIQHPRIKQRNACIQTAKEHFHQLLTRAKRTIGIGSPRATLEANFALRSLVGETNFFSGIEDTEYQLLQTVSQIIRDGGIHSPSMREVEQADALLILGEDVTHSAPRLALSLRQAARNVSIELAASALHVPSWQNAAVREIEKQALTPVFIASIGRTRLDDIALDTYHGSPDYLANFGFAIAHYLDSSAPEANALDADENKLAHTIAAALKQAKRPLIVSGTSCSSLAVIQAAYNIAKALPSPNRQLTFTLPECNSLGLALMAGNDLQQAFTAIEQGQADTVVILENDLYRRAEKQKVDAFLETAEQLVVIDSLKNPTTEKADLLLPAASFAESEGTLVNNEGRAQRYFPVYPAPDSICASWQWLLGTMENSSWQHHDDLTTACAQAFPDLTAITQVAPGADYRVKGSKIPRQPHRYSGRTALHANIDVSEPGQPTDSETPFAYSMEGNMAQVPPALLPVVWSPGWDSNQAINKFQEETGGHLREGDAGIRLFEVSGTLAWFNGIPKPYISEPGVWEVMALPHIFGSEELSLQSPAIAQRLATVCALMNPLDAEQAGIDNGDCVIISDLSGASLLTTVIQIDTNLSSAGLLCITAGHPKFQALKMGMQVTLRKFNSDSEVGS